LLDKPDVEVKIDADQKDEPIYFKAVIITFSPSSFSQGLHGIVCKAEK
jgi:hypothetical protein